MAWAASYFINFKDKGFTKFLKIGIGVAMAFIAIYFIQQRLQIENLSVDTINQSTQSFQGVQIMEVVGLRVILLLLEV